MWPLHLRVRVRDKGSRGRRRTCQSSSASNVVNLVTAKKDEEKEQQAASIEIDRLSSRLEEDFAMFVDIPLGVRWGNLVL